MNHFQETKFITVKFLPIIGKGEVFLFSALQFLEVFVLAKQNDKTITFLKWGMLINFFNRTIYIDAINIRYIKWRFM